MDVERVRVQVWPGIIGVGERSEVHEAVLAGGRGLVQIRCLCQYPSNEFGGCFGFFRAQCGAAALAVLPLRHEVGERGSDAGGQNPALFGLNRDGDRDVAFRDGGQMRGQRRFRGSRGSGGLEIDGPLGCIDAVDGRREGCCDRFEAGYTLDTEGVEGTLNPAAGSVFPTCGFPGVFPFTHICTILGWPGLLVYLSDLLA